MSLMRLLSAGKSLVGLKDNASRYRMGNPGMFPKFGSGKNPFGKETKAMESIQGQAEGPSDPGKSETIATTKLPASVPETSCSPQPSPPKEERGKTHRARTALTLGWTLQAKVADWIERKKMRRQGPEVTLARSAVPRSNKRPLQPELSLDQIKVVRNDLSDTDFEVVPTGTKLGGPRKKIEPATEVEANEMAANMGSRRLSGRLHQNNQNAPVTSETGSEKERARSAQPPPSPEEKQSATAGLSRPGAGWLAAVQR